MAARLLTSAAALGAMALAASPAVAQQIFYEDGEYLFAVPAPVMAQDAVVSQAVEAPSVTGEDGVTYNPSDTVTAQRVIPARNAPEQYAPQQIILPAPQPAYAGPAYAPIIYSPSRQAQAPYVVASRSIPAGGYGYAPAAQQYSGYAAAPQQSGYLPGGGQLVSFDRNVWLEECSSRLSTYEDSDRGQVLGGLIGAAAGGLLGNRVAGSGNRLGGTLIGAGTGALAGLAVGDAIDDRNDARNSRSGYEECRAYLDDYMNRASNNPAPVTTVPGQQYMLVPVSVPVAQQAVYREYVGSQP